jgi:hypothetical protein
MKRLAMLFASEHRCAAFPGFAPFGFGSRHAMRLEPPQVDTSLSDPAPHEEPTSDGGARSRDALRRGRRTLRTFHGRFLK